MFDEKAFYLFSENLRFWSFVKIMELKIYFEDDPLHKKNLIKGKDEKQGQINFTGDQSQKITLPYFVFQSAVWLCFTKN